MSGATCRYCGAPVQRTGSRGPAPSYCCAEHRRRYQDERRLRDRHRIGCRLCGAPLPKGHRTCADCQHEQDRITRTRRLGCDAAHSGQMRVINREVPTLVIP